ncbi:MAG: hypothetical protein WAT36_04410 [Chromatiaceae bacterium]
MSASILEHFSPLHDPRVERNKLHALADILLPTVQWGRRLGGDRSVRPGKTGLAAPVRAVQERRAIP